MGSDHPPSSGRREPRAPTKSSGVPSSGIVTITEQYARVSVRTLSSTSRRAVPRSRLALVRTLVWLSLEMRSRSLSSSRVRSARSASTVPSVIGAPPSGPGRGPPPGNAALRAHGRETLVRRELPVAQQHLETPKKSHKFLGISGIFRRRVALKGIYYTQATVSCARSKRRVRIGRRHPPARERNGGARYSGRAPRKRRNTRFRSAGGGRRTATGRESPGMAEVDRSRHSRGFGRPAALWAVSGASRPHPEPRSAGRGTRSSARGRSGAAPSTPTDPRVARGGMRRTASAAPGGDISMRRHAGP